MVTGVDFKPIYCQQTGVLELGSAGRPDISPSSPLLSISISYLKKLSLHRDRDTAFLITMCLIARGGGVLWVSKLSFRIIIIAFRLLTWANTPSEGVLRLTWNQYTF